MCLCVCVYSVSISVTVFVFVCLCQGLRKIVCVCVCVCVCLCMCGEVWGGWMLPSVWLSDRVDKADQRPPRHSERTRQNRDGRYHGQPEGGRPPPHHLQR